MKKSNFFQRFKDSIRHRNSNRDRQDARNDRSTPTPTLLEEDTSSVVDASQNSPSLSERSSRTSLSPLRATESLASATPGRTPSPATHPITPLSQTTLPVSENVPSLWNRAYEALRDKDVQLVERYEILLSQELDKPDTANGPQGLPQQNDVQDRHNNRIHTDPDKRHAQLKTITDRGLQRVDEKQTKYTIFGHQFVLRDQVKEAAQFVQALKGLVNEAVKASPEASLVWAGMCVLLPVFTNPSAAEEANRDGLSYVTSRLRYYVELECLLWPRPLANPGLKAKFDDHVVELYQRILEFQVKTVIRFYRKLVNRLVSDIIQHDEWEGMLSKIKGQEQIVRDESNHLQLVASGRTLQHISEAAQQNYDNMRSLLSYAKDHLDVSRDHRDISEEQLQLQVETINSLPLDLPVVNEARYGSVDFDKSPKCENGTRDGILKRISQWAVEDTAEPFFWLIGPAGTGKSSIARTFAESFDSDEQPVAGYFFKRGEQGRNDIARLLPTIASQLIHKIPGLKGCLWKSLNGRNSDAVENMALKFQFEQLLLQPLKDLPPSNTSKSTKAVIVIDALDECESTNKELSTALNQLRRLETLRTISLRVLLTSRSIPGLNHVFEDFQLKKVVRSLDLHRDFSNESQADIRTFLQARFADIKKKVPVLEDPWPAPRQLDHLVRLATNPKPLFIYASTLCRFIYDEENAEPPDIRLESWLLQSGSNKSQLDQMYAPIFKMAFSGKNEAQHRQLLQFLGAVVTLANPLSATSLASLLNLSASKVNWWLRQLHSVLDIPTDTYRPIRPLHKSFSDFLLRQGDSGPGDYQVDAAETHAMLAAKCIQRMNDGLKRDICNTQKPDVQRDEIDKEVMNTHIPADLRYACLHWVYHLQQSGGSLGDDVCEFLYKHFLHWIEVLGLLGKISDGTAAIKQLINMCQGRNAPAELREFITDASSVIASFGFMVEQTPLQIYAALILFCPVASKVRERFWNQRLPNLPHVHGVKSGWDALRQTLEGHTALVNAVAFSPDGQVVASASDDSTVRLWDAATGAPQQTLKGHTKWVNAVAFSPDGQVVASASGDETVQLWDVATSAPRQTLKGHTKWVNAVAFSLDGQVVASASGDETVRLWDVATGAPRQTLKGHTALVNVVAFSPDGQVVASASRDSTVQLWDAATGAPRQTLKGHTALVNAVAFSPDGQVVASASDDKTVRLWDAATGAPRQTLKGHTAFVNAVAFSPDGQVVASASSVPSPTLKSRMAFVNAVAFSPDGQVVASASGDKTVRLWDAATGAPRQTLEGFSRTLAFDQCSNTRLLTDFGAADVVTGSLTAESYPRGETSSSSAMRGLGISPNHIWIMEGQKKIIWLPNEYRPTASAMRGSIMCIGCASGRVMHILAISHYP